MQKQTELAFQTSLTKDGKERNDPRPMKIPLGSSIPESLTSQIKRLISVQMSEQAQKDGNETFEEANDFETEDSFEEAEMTTMYQVMPEEFIEQLSEDPSETLQKGEKPPQDRRENPVVAEPDDEKEPKKSAKSAEK